MRPCTRRPPRPDSSRRYLRLPERPAGRPKSQNGSARATGVGVDLGDLCPAAPIEMASLSGRVVAIDAYNTLYQFLAIIRGPDGTPLRDDQGRVTSHLMGLFNRTANFVEAGLEPVF